MSCNGRDSTCKGQETSNVVVVEQGLDEDWIESRLCRLRLVAVARHGRRAHQVRMNNLADIFSTLVHSALAAERVRTAMGSYAGPVSHSSLDQMDDTRLWTAGSFAYSEMPVTYGDRDLAGVYDVVSLSPRPRWDPH